MNLACGTWVNQLSKLALMLSIASFLGACREGIDLADPGTTDPIILPPDQLGVPNDAAGFYVKLHKPDKMEYYQHRVTGYDQDCKVSSLTSAGNVDIKCVFDIPEEDLHFHGANMQYNVPSDMCSYFTVSPYMFENYFNQASQGAIALATSVTVYIGPDGAPYLDDAGADDGVGLTSDFSTLAIDSLMADGTPKCSYDYSSPSNSNPNCCEGDYRLTVHKWNKDKLDSAGLPDPGYENPVTSDRSWGGRLSSCYAGPAFDVPGVQLTSGGWPKTDIYYVEGTGVNKSLEPPTPLSKGTGTVYLANHFELIDDLTSLPEAATHSLANLPVALRSPYVNRRDAYEFRCLDRAQETLARIRVYVKEWNQYSEFLAKGDPYTGGSEPGFGNDDINDFNEWYTLDARALSSGKFPGSTRYPYLSFE
jgi:hypothetical protein